MPSRRRIPPSAAFPGDVWGVNQRRLEPLGLSQLGDAGPWLTSQWACLRSTTPSNISCREPRLGPSIFKRFLGMRPGRARDGQREAGGLQLPLSDSAPRTAAWTVITMQTLGPEARDGAWVLLQVPG